MKQITCPDCGHVFSTKAKDNSVTKCPSCNGSIYLSSELLHNKEQETVISVNSAAVTCFIILFWMWLLAAVVLAVLMVFRLAVYGFVTAFVFLAFAKILQVLLSINKHLATYAKPMKE
jgi:hypothetical protein